MTLTIEETTILKEIAREKKLDLAIKAVSEKSEADTKIKRDEIAVIEAKRDSDIVTLRNA